MKNVFRIIAFVAGLFTFLALLQVRNSEALPLFARRIGRDCSFCHMAFPKLNERGRIFRSNGYRFAEEESWEDVRRWDTLPLSMEVEVEGLYDRTHLSGTVKESSDLKIGEAELLSAGTVGRTGRVTFYGVIGAEETINSDGSTSYDPFIGDAFVQINDLAGPRGQGMLNIRAGQWETGALPFLSHSQRLLDARYMAQNSLNVFRPAERALELNGSVAADEENYIPTQRYSVGLSREDTVDDDRMKGFYSTYSLTFAESMSLGAVFRSGRERAAGGGDTSYIKYGLAGELYTGRIIVAAGLFRSEPHRGPTLTDYLAEATVFPIRRFLLTARLDLVETKNRKDATLVGVSLRYYILSNVYTTAEYSRLTDRDHVTSTLDEERRVRFSLVALL